MNPNPVPHFRHGYSRTPTYRAWYSMFDKKANAEVDPQWSDFCAFLNDMGPKPKGLVLSRKDNTKPHGPTNSVWVTYKRSFFLAGTRRRKKEVNFGAETKEKQSETAENAW